MENFSEKSLNKKTVSADNLFVDCGFVSVVLYLEKLTKGKIMAKRLFSTPKNEIEIIGNDVWMETAKDQYTVVDLFRIDEILTRTWCAHWKEKFRIHTDRFMSEGGGKLSLAGFLLFGVNGKDGELTADHKDRNPINNHMTNLRPATKFQQSLNRLFLNGSSIYNGVSRNSRDDKWEVRGPKNGKSLQQYLGSFDDEIDAARTYNDACRNNLSPEDLMFAVLNPVI